ncbi:MULTISPECIES: adenosine deaminase [unclassified Gilliamella]|uniref:adenosine deaminase n=1 Tax=unclassified Gilliamella TaxID=2685620 RepID=UPI00226A091C|nr:MULTISPECIES: adenosine deaminase [unclassified Gilliamella]MCX8641932.1 adenosine deaminase [Gilliamella sp. B3835]MCX8706941.1 adenosine deaminase [Gilliamella sp. B3783]MCX8708800.1 adenosine deaminase [Gilliamella sp. B3780]MCX8713583.1 adenosine deaminase [Gilliamella sp. B3781]MCX8715455.1 adenosine deaminase [Gilliamella sp. B3784]
MNKLIVPKVILHEHVEGSITPLMAKTLADKNHMPFSPSLCYSSGEYDKDAYPYGRYRYDETDFVQFIQTYDTVSNFVKTPEDYYLITYDFLYRNAKQGLIYCELFLSPYHICATESEGEIIWDQDKFHQTLQQMDNAIIDVQKQFNITVRYHVIGVRHLGAKLVYDTLRFIERNPHPFITGFNIAGNEKSGHFDDFEKAHQLASKLNLKKSYHAGEIESAESIINALKHGASRIGHGIRAIEDQNLIHQLVTQNVTLEIALTSNRILVNELQGDLHNHPIRQLYENGVRITLNTDDAGIFGTDIEKEYQLAQSMFHFSRLELLDITLCGIDAAFIEDSIKTQLTDYVLSCFTLADKQDLKQAIAGTNYHPAIVARFTQYQKLLFKTS